MPATARLSLIVFLALSVGASRAEAPDSELVRETPAGSEFRWIGQIGKGLTPISGPVDVVLSLWDAPSGGVQRGPTLSFTSIAVISGVYDVALDFGFDPFNGDALWIETTYRYPASHGLWTTLSRDLVGAWPYAQNAFDTARIGGWMVSALAPSEGQVLKWNATTRAWEPAGDLDTQYTAGDGLALSAGVFSFDTPFGDGRYVNEGQNQAVTTEMLADGAITLPKLAAVGPPAAGDVLAYDGGQMAWAPLPPDSWSAFGSDIFYNAGNVGIGTASPQSRLEVAGIVHSTTGGFKFPDGTLMVAAPAPGLPVNMGQLATLRWDQAQAEYAVGDEPVGIAFDGANIWIANRQGNTVTKLRASDSVELGTFAVPANPSYLACDGANIWVTQASSNEVSRLRATDGALTGTYPVGSVPQFLTFDGSNVWIGNTGDGTVTKLRASDGANLGTYPTGNGVYSLAFDGVHIWVVNHYAGSLTKLRASDGENLGTYPIPYGSVGILFDGTALWVSNFYDSTVMKLSPVDATVLATIPVGGTPHGLAFDGAHVWVACVGGEVLMKLRAADGAVAETISQPGGPITPVFDGVSVWTTNYLADTVAKWPATLTSGLLGGGTANRLVKFTTPSAVGDSAIVEVGGKVGIGTETPGSALTVAGQIETLAGGVKFPDGTVQTTAAVSSAFGRESGRAAVNVIVPPHAVKVALGIQFKHAFASPPVVMVTGTTASSPAALLIPHALEITATSFSLALANPSGTPVSGVYSFNWLAMGCDAETWYRDMDLDRYSDGSSITGHGSPPYGYYPASALIATAGDCDDGNAMINPGAAEVCDGLDNDCNGFVDDNVCPPVTNADSVCVNGQCVTVCHTGYGDCNNDLPTDGCEANLANDVSNCGACGLACPAQAPHADSLGCVNGDCQYACHQGFADCNGNVIVDGCETDLASDPGNCGMCAHQCPPGQICFQGICLP